MDDTEPGNTVTGQAMRSKTFSIHCLIHVNCLKALAPRSNTLEYISEPVLTFFYSSTKSVLLPSLNITV